MTLLEGFDMDSFLVCIKGHFNSNEKNILMQL